MTHEMSTSVFVIIGGSLQADGDTAAYLRLGQLMKYTVVAFFGGAIIALMLQAMGPDGLRATGQINLLQMGAAIMGAYVISLGPGLLLLVTTEDLDLVLTA